MSSPEGLPPTGASCSLLLQVWPHVQAGRGVDASDSTPHWAYQHAVQWWITQARRALPACPPA
jgi:hypothetical protein